MADDARDERHGAARPPDAARADEIVGERDGAVLARVTAPPLECRAKEALRRLIARLAGVAVGRVEIVRAANSRQKLVRVEGLASEHLRAARCGPCPSAAVRSLPPIPRPAQDETESLLYS
jgi:uncharacterized protein